jgi:hypothetical protein
MPYRMYLDEVGNDDTTNVSDERYRYLSLTGVVAQIDHVRDFINPAMDLLKRTHFKVDPDRPVILHRKDIINFGGAFGGLRDLDKRNAFDASLLKYLSDGAYCVITAVLDKKGMLNQHHWGHQHPYHYLMEIMVEKFAKYLERQNSTGDIMPEKRYGKKDTALQEAFEVVRLDGTHFITAKRICERLPSKYLRFRSKDENVAGLQVCDLLAHPSHQYVRMKQGHQIELGAFAQKIVPILDGAKYDRSAYYGTIKGYGWKYLP